MASSEAASVEAYLAELPEDRRAAIARVREVILENLPDGFEETMQYGMPSYVVPLERYPVTYNGRPLAIASLASQKKYMSLYLMGVYGERDGRFREEYAKTGKKLDMGKSCVRFRSVDDLPLDLIGRTIASTSVDEFVRAYEDSRSR
jgi:uncharacterized protein YdhG (YjbR/CyaY superfamily)